MSRDCDFVQDDESMDGFIDKNESGIINACYGNELLSKEIIKKN
ncbi:MAG: hypothetical protein ACI86M_002768 [Saprospiraceae bacterium]|jgi:hypothetical protein